MKRFEQKEVDPVKISEKGEESSPLDSKKENPGMDRRSFLKFLAAAGASAAAIGTALNLNSIKNAYNNLVDESESDEPESPERDESFWYKIIEDVARKTNEAPTPQELRAYLITQLFRIPQGWTSGLGTKEKTQKVDSDYLQSLGIEINQTERTTPNLDRLVATHFTNRSTKAAEVSAGIIPGLDFRILPHAKQNLEEFKEEIEKLSGEEKELGLKMCGIMEGEQNILSSMRKSSRKIEIYEILEKEHTQQGILKEYPNEYTVYLAYLPGGNPIFVRGYRHITDWSRFYNEALAKTYAEADYIAIEGYQNESFGESLGNRWEKDEIVENHYAGLMKSLVRRGFSGKFIEIDARDSSKVIMDRTYYSYFPALPYDFFEKFFDYLQRENPRLIEKIDNPLKLKNYLAIQSTTDEGLFERSKKTGLIIDEYDHLSYSSVNLSGKISTTPTGMELGQSAFADALSALKLHFLAQAMNEGKIFKGVVVDFQGASHISLKSFYLKDPTYAAETVLRMINELMAGYAGRELTKEEFKNEQNVSENLEEIYRNWEKPDWTKIIREMGRIPMGHIEGKELVMEPELNLFEDIDENVVRLLFSDKYLQDQIDNFSKRISQTEKGDQS